MHSPHEVDEVLRLVAEGWNDCQIFRDACDAIGVPHRNSTPNTISIARRDGVVALDAFIGPKA